MSTEEFFELPETLEVGLQPLTKADEPTIYLDGNNELWHLVMIDGKPHRKMLLP